MGAGTNLIVGGLLQGAGKGLLQMHEERRQAALIALKRGYEVEDQNREIAYKTAAEKRAAELRATERTEAQEDRKEIIDYTAKYDETADARRSRLKREERATDHSYDVQMAKVNAKLDVIKTKEAERVKAAIGRGEVQSTRIGEDGSLIVIYKDGRTVQESKIKLHITDRDEDGGNEGGGIDAARERRGGAAPAKPAANNDIPGPKGAALAAFGNAYTKAASGDPKQVAEVKRQYPAMFGPDGKLRPRAELIAQINQRYGQ